MGKPLLVPAPKRGLLELGRRHQRLLLALSPFLANSAGEMLSFRSVEEGGKEFGFVEPGLLRRPLSCDGNSCCSA